MSLFDPPWRAEHRVLQSRLTPDECAARLERQIAPLFGYRTTLPVRGWAAPHGFSLTKAINYRNSFQTQARGRFEAAGEGTRIHVKLRLSPLVIGFMGIWCGGLAGVLLMFVAVGATMLAASGLQTPQTASDVIAVAMPVGILTVMLAFGVGLLAFGRWMARDEADFLLRFLGDTLEAHEPPATPK